MIRKRGAEENVKIEELVEKLRQMGRDVIIIETDEAIFPNTAFSVEQAAAILKEVADSIKKRLN